ncbi:unnamed protein product [Anisakis simplex]|uniref:Uncharacterized protein n=1 Tax=Anisakis simplex TaxID=6269 RepID=A0A0M3JBU3_ANISI|nr:unnamed protein product [Anisakis simplex]
MPDFKVLDRLRLKYWHNLIPCQILHSQDPL